MRVLFGEGYIFSNGAQESRRPGEPVAQTFLDIVFDQAKHAPPICYDGDRVAHLYRKPTPAAAKQLADAVQAVTEAMSDRVRVETSELDLGILFTAFDLARWCCLIPQRVRIVALCRPSKLPVFFGCSLVRLKCFCFRPPAQVAAHSSDPTRDIVGNVRLGVTATESTPPAASHLKRRAADDVARDKGDDTKLNALKKHARMMFKGWRQPDHTAALEARALQLCRQVSWSRDVDNRVAWCGVLHSLDDNEAGMAKMIRIYLVAMDSTCGVERGLGCLTRVLAAHAGPLDEGGTTAADLTEIHLDGPDSEAGLAARPAHDAALEPTDFCRECAELWLTRHGRRFRVYNVERKPGPKPKSQRSLVGLTRLAKQASDARVKTGVEKSGDDNTFLGIPRSNLFRPLPRDNPARLSEELKRFRKLSNRKTKNAIALHQQRRLAGNPYRTEMSKPSLRLGGVFGVEESGRRPQPSRTSASGGVYFCVDFCRHAVAQRPGYSVSRFSNEARQLVLQMSKCNLLIMDTPWFIDWQAEPTRMGIGVNLCAVAFGCAVLAKADWGSCRPHPEGPPEAQVVHFKPLYREQRAFFLTPAFRQSQPFVASVFEGVTKTPGSKWVIVPASKEACTKFQTLQDLRGWLLNERRVAHAGAGKVHIGAARQL